MMADLCARLFQNPSITGTFTEMTNNCLVHFFWSNVTFCLKYDLDLKGRATDVTHNTSSYEGCHMIRNPTINGRVKGKTRVFMVKFEL